MEKTSTHLVINSNFFHPSSLLFFVMFLLIIFQLESLPFLSEDGPDFEFIYNNFE